MLHSLFGPKSPWVSRLKKHQFYALLTPLLHCEFQKFATPQTLQFSTKLIYCVCELAFNFGVSSFFLFCFLLFSLWAHLVSYLKFKL